MEIKQLSLGPLGTNCFIVFQGSEALIIDPGDEGEKVKSFINKNKLTPLAILLTHAHFDHIGAVDNIRDEYNIQVYLNSMEHSWLGDPMLNGSKFFSMPEARIKDADSELKEGILSLGSFMFDVRHTPGHSPGSMSFVFHDAGFVVVGDTLFQGSIGRTDLPGGNYQQLLEHIKKKILVLPTNMVVYPGHGLPTSVGEEKATNPFLNS